MSFFRHLPFLHRSALLILFLFLPLESSLAIVTQRINSATLTNSILLDADGADANPATNRHTAITHFECFFEVTAPQFGHNADYRIAYQLRDTNNTPLVLVNGDPTHPTLPKFVAYTAAQNISLTRFAIFPASPVPSRTVDFSAYPDPATTLDPKETYNVYGELQRSNDGGVTWFTVTLIAPESEATTPSEILHLTNTTSGDAPYNVRAGIRDFDWTRRHMVNDSDSIGSFQASLELFGARYDGFNAGFFIQNIPFQLDFDLIESGTNRSIPLENNGEMIVIRPLANHTFGINTSPATFTTNVVANIIPLEQLNTASRTFILRCKLSHTEAPDTSYNDLECDLGTGQLLHFNGNLLFDNIVTTFGGLGNTPLAAGGTTAYLNTQIRIPAGAGQIPGRPEYAFGNNALLSVRLQENGDSRLTAGIQSLYHADTPANQAIQCDFGGSSLTFSSVNLSTNGATAQDVSIKLPQGLSYFPNTNTNAFRGVAFIQDGSEVHLDSALCPASPIDIPAGANSAVADESHPLIFSVNKLKVAAEGLEFDATGVKYAHAETYVKLTELVEADGPDQLPEEFRDRISNDRYLLTVDSVFASLRFTAAPDGSARMTAEVKVKPQEFHPHFPLGSRLQHDDLSTLSYLDGQVNLSSSLTGKPQASVPYSATCAGDSCTEEIDPKKIDFIAQGDSLEFTPGGGLYAVGAMDSEEGALIWGLRSPEQYAHRTDAFQKASFYMPGYQLYADENALHSAPHSQSIAGDQAAALLLLSGYDRKAEDLNYYSQANYRLGRGSLAGMNFELEEESFFGASRLGGVKEDYPYQLLSDKGNGGCKYYARMGGISGRQIAAEGTFGKSTELHGFPVEFKSFQLTFLDNDNEHPACDSWVNGGVRTVGPYAEWSQEFDGLRFDCYGEPGTMNPNKEDADGKYLNHWISEFDLKTLRFGRAPVLDSMGEEQCPKEFTAKLVAGVKTGASHIATPLYGALAFCPDGSLSTAANPIEGVDSQLRIPASIPLSGPNKDYTLVSASKLRFSNPLLGEDFGFVTFAATIDIPYFVDLQVQAITYATAPPEDGEADTIAELSLTPGWTDDQGRTFFTHENFDDTHRGYPLDISLFDYRHPTPESPYLIEAEQDLFGFIPLTYPLLWNFDTRRFKSATPQRDDLFVTEVEHQIEWMDAKFTNISFGAKYDGLPSISLSNFLNGQIDGAADAISSLIEDLGKETVDQAFDSLDKLLEDSTERLIDPIVDAAADAVNPDAPISALRNTIAQLHDSSATYDVFRGKVEQLLNTPLDPLYATGFKSPFIEHVKTIADATETAHSVITQIDTALKQVVTGIDTIVHGVKKVDGKAVYFPELPDSPDIQGILFKEDGQRNIVRSLTQRLLIETVDADLRAIIEPLILAGTGDLNDGINAALTEIEPTLDQISSTLLQLRATLVEIQKEVGIVEAEVASAVGLAKRIRETIINAEIDGSLDELIRPISQRAWSRYLQAESALGIDPASIADMSEIEGFLDEFNTNAFTEELKSELKYALLGSDIVSNIRFALRQQIYDIQQRVTSSFQSILAEISTVMKDAISESIAPLDKSIAPFLGDISEYMGSGEISGYAEINGDSLRKLRLDAEMKLTIPEEMKLNVYLEILAYSSEDNFTENGCIQPGEKAVEVKIGATDVAIDWVSEIRASMEIKVSLKDFPSDSIDWPVPIGVAGKFEMTGGELDFQTFKITEFGATIAIGLEECYLGAKARATFSNYEMAAGIFFGRTCTIDPLVFVDPDVGEVVEPGTTFTGAYVYGEVWLPISELVLGVPASCMFRIDAGVGAGAFYFVEGPTFGGKMLLGVSGEALCLVSIRGEIKMTLASQAGQLRGSGKGTFKAKVGACPFCVKFKKSVKVKYDNGNWGIN